MKKNYFLLTLLFFTGSLIYSQCTLNLRMYDDYGDGWNNNTITVTADTIPIIVDKIFFKNDFILFFLG